MNEQQSKEQPSPQQMPNSPSLQPVRVCWDSDELLQGEKEVLISHHGEVYRLRETRNGKLLLGK
ncbi:MAG: hemin uptake protein HemP [Planctomycetales bacterium]|nr:hemin uptake protein HemP [Planctomycetales bacterium]